MVTTATSATETGRRPNTADAVVARAVRQALIFADRPRRIDLSRLRAEWDVRTLRVRCHRNQPFEYLQEPLRAFLRFAGFDPDFAVGDYDDSLAFDLQDAADVEVLWLDYERYREESSGGQLAKWLCGRVQALRGRSSAPILILDWPAPHPRAARFNRAMSEACGMMAGIRLCPAHEVQGRLGDAFFDERFVAIGASRLSSVASVALAQRLGLQWLPAAVAPRLKGVVFDLDETLWGGVLGEDGPGGLSSEGYHVLYEQIGRLKASGMFVGLLSRNEFEDVRTALNRRPDVALDLERFDAVRVSWQPKAAALAEIAADWRVSPEAILFVDDNPGELASAAMAQPGLWTLMAGPSPADTARGIDLFPGLFAWSTDATDALRSKDLAASKLRENLAELTPDAYLSALEIELHVAVDNPALTARLHQLSNKTNQFNLSLRRYSEAAVAAMVAAPDWRVVTVSLRDRLSDSGVVAAVFLRSEGDTVSIDELCISCRALGRGVENQLVRAAILAGASEETTSVSFNPREGERNRPALEWLARFSEMPQPLPERVNIVWDRAAAAVMLEAAPVRVRPS